MMQNECPVLTHDRPSAYILKNELVFLRAHGVRCVFGHSIRYGELVHWRRREWPSEILCEAHATDTMSRED